MEESTPLFQPQPPPPKPNTTALGLVPTVHSPEDPVNKAPHCSITHPLKGVPVSTGGDGEQGLGPKEQQLREVPALAITGPGYRAIAQGRQSQVWAPGTDQLAEVV